VACDGDAVDTVGVYFALANAWTRNLYIWLLVIASRFKATSSHIANAITFDPTTIAVSPSRGCSKWPVKSSKNPMVIRKHNAHTALRTTISEELSGVSLIGLLSD